MQTTTEGRAWLNDTVARIVARHPLPEAERVGVRYELTSHLHSAAEARAREAGRDEVTVGDLVAALEGLGGEDALADAFVRPRSVLPARAGLARRAAAYLLDVLLVYGGVWVAWALLFLLLAPVAALAGGSLAPFRPNPFQFMDYDDMPWNGPADGGALAAMAFVGAVLGILSLLIPLAYFTWFEAHGGRTLGKKALDLRVLREDGAPVPVRDALLRNVVKAAPFFPVLLVVDALFILYEGRRQRASDRIFGTVVVHEGAAT